MRECVRVPGCRMKREHIVIVTQVKRNRLRMKMAVPRPVSPSKRLGMTERTKATPPVDMVMAYHAKVKCLRRSIEK